MKPLSLTTQNSLQDVKKYNPARCLNSGQLRYNKTSSPIRLLSILGQPKGTRTQQLPISKEVAKEIKRSIRSRRVANREILSRRVLEKVEHTCYESIE